MFGLYMAFTNDCSPNLSDERWLTRGIILEVGTNGRVLVRRLRWQQGQEQVPQFPEKILCERHNNALSKVGAIAFITDHGTFNLIHTGFDAPGGGRWFRAGSFVG
jgi:hypothetical protein